MNRLAFVFTQGPYGSSSGSEGLDAILATSAVNDNIGLFFISDGVLVLLPDQKPKKIFSRDFISTFGLLKFCNIDRIYLCSESARNRGMHPTMNLVLDVQWLTASTWRKMLSDYDVILTF